jgi:hypothetical protein
MKYGMKMVKRSKKSYPFESLPLSVLISDC